ncbi:hypothetical protein [Limnoglobus roseus]|uniref:Lipoprotein n=1 Tax=Limnoglobus roseus TaxID=2598579 RepID=A0A5C1A9K5_9BACT|nr:hypothetical protein [Limnoglobus roseus]QEL14726.1 hypothetical protein PX52LOC_01620 [Limnoglobus roseus]
MFRTCQLLAVLVTLAGAVGCGGPKEESISVKVDPMVQVKSTLERYANGQPLGSEVTSYDYMVNEVRKVDAAKADILKAGLEDIQKTKGSPAAKAKDLMKKLNL